MICPFCGAAAIVEQRDELWGLVTLHEAPACAGFAALCPPGGATLTVDFEGYLLPPSPGVGVRLTAPVGAAVRYGRPVAPAAGAICRAPGGAPERSGAPEGGAGGARSESESSCGKGNYRALTRRCVHSCDALPCSGCGCPAPRCWSYPPPIVKCCPDCKCGELRCWSWFPIAPAMRCVSRKSREKASE